MPLLEWTDFKREIDALVAIYRQDNRWVGSVISPSWNYEYHMYHYIRAAYLLYRATGRNALKHVLLGGTNIRKSREYIMNFGVTAANGIQDPETEDAVQYTEQERADIVTRPRDFPPMNADNRVISAQKVGSILSEKRWTPILNDALIIGAATGNQNFMIALEPYEQGLWRECEATLRPALVRLRDQYAQRFGGNPSDEFVRNTQEYRHMVWQRFFSWNLGMFWDTNYNNPRVLTRELLGLAMFHYKVELGDRQIGFRPRLGHPDPTFAAYVNGLRNLRFHDGTARARIMRAVSTFLLGDRYAISFRADRPAPAPAPAVAPVPPIYGGQPVQFV
eukprot:g1013.t1